MEQAINHPSIFNDVMAPVTQGPSSSNTVGPYRIGRLASAMLNGKPKELKVEMSKGGGFYMTFYGMDSDKAFIAGVLGKDLINSDLGRVYDEAKKEGLSYEFSFTDRIEKLPSEMGEVTLSSDEETIVLTGISLGGGEILIRDINGKPCEIKGIYPMDIKIDDSDISRSLPSVYPYPRASEPNVPFTSGEEMLKFCKENKKEIWEAALAYECAVTGLSEDEVKRIASDTLDIAYNSMDKGYETGIEFDGPTIAKAPEMKRLLSKSALIPMGIGERGALDSLAIMEYSSSHGIIVCMPTGGASSIVPASIRTTAQTLKKTREDEIKALLTAGIIGMFYFPTHYHGSIGCQAEVGVATSMAAAALCYFISDDPDTVERAAVLAIQTLLGQVCDPIEGYPQIPCFIRNATSVSIAGVCANMATLGLDTAISIDEMVKAVLRVGQKLLENRINDLGCCGCSFCANPDSRLAKESNK